MTDDLDRLKTALQNTPAPEQSKKADHIAMAEKIFATHQETAAQPRQTPTWFEGARNMLNALTSRAGLMTTTGLASVALAVVVTLPQLDRPFDFASSDAPVVVSEAEFRSEALVLGDAASAADTTLAEPIVEPLILAEPSAMQADLDTLSSPANRGLVAGGATFKSAPPRDLPVVIPAPSTESFANEAPNPVKITREDPVSTFSIDVDTASYSVMRSSLMLGQMPPSEAIRVEELMNYFPYDYPAPEGDMPFRSTVTVSDTPWNADTRLVHIGIQGALPQVADRPPLNLVFLIDTSGSMNQPNKLPLLKQSFRLMLAELRPTDQISIVTYAGSAGQVLAPTNAEDRTAIMSALDNLSAGGSTAGQAGLQQAYSVAEEMTKDGDVTRVILATDGDFNVGLSDPDALETFIADKRETGTYLSVLGFGRGNLDDATMQALAQNGNGNAAYIDTLSEARKVLVDELTGALFPIANDVKIQVEFNPATVAEYRLIGYETRALKREDFNNDKVDAGDIGAGHTVTALYEVTPIGSPAILNDALRYQASDPASTGPLDELGYLRLRYKAPGASSSDLIETAIPMDSAASSEAGFASAIAGFGQLLRGSEYMQDWTFTDAIALASDTKGADPFGYRTEAITLMRLAESLSK